MLSTLFERFASFCFSLIELVIYFIEHGPLRLFIVIPVGQCGSLLDLKNSNMYRLRC